ncbi:putative sensor with CHASE2 domain protein [Calothrix sp. NIES-4071]|nr:putative sensor with CHASE2 domain protein [Calothrix sp. NIES-4071]BAZ55067.1 putative sensor with CHASE2 domain protein [Calothrix sp. NIES-4105]
MLHVDFLQLRPPEASDPEVVIVGINEDDIRTVGKYPIPDRDLAELLTIIQSYKPTAIGLDIFRDLTYSPDRVKLSNILENSPNFKINIIPGLQYGVSQPGATIKNSGNLAPGKNLTLVGDKLDLTG